MKILIVDDSKAMRTIVIRTLRMAGYGDHTFVEAINGVDALKVIDAEKPDIVLSDWNMPEMTGFELLKVLKKQGSKIKFGFVTSEGSAEMRRRAMEAGALFLITKSFTAETFQKTLGSLLSPATGLAVSSARPEQSQSTSQAGPEDEAHESEGGYLAPRIRLLLDSIAKTPRSKMVL